LALCSRPAEWSENWRLAALHRASGVVRCVWALLTPPRQDRAAMLMMLLNPPKKSKRPAGMVVGTPPWYSSSLLKPRISLSLSCSKIHGGVGCELADR